MEFLQVTDGKITDSQKNPVFLRGVCVGGWMNLEDFINGYPGTESGIRRRMAEILGPAKSEFFFERMADYFFTEDDIQFLAECGANCIRIPLNYRQFEADSRPFVYLEEGFSRLDQVIRLCEKYGIYAILDLHAVQGWQNCHWHCDNERGAAMFWVHPHFQDRLVSLWEEIARRYEGKSAVAGYDLMNEPSSGTPEGEHPFDFYENYRADWDKINSVYRRLVSAIRKIDPRHIIFLEGDNYSRLFDGLEAPFAENLVYASHNYTAPGFGPGAYPGHYGSENGEIYWDEFRHEREFRNHPGHLFAEKYQVPHWIGEFGSQYHGPHEELGDRLRSMDDQIRVYNRYGVHWTTWTYKDAGVMGLVTLDPDCEYLQIIKPVQEMKRELGAENFVAQFKPSPGRLKARELSDLIADVSQIPGVRRDAAAYTFNYAALTGFAAATLQPAYAVRFAGMSEQEMDRVLQAFCLKNCQINEDFRRLLKHRFADGSQYFPESRA